MNTTLLIFGILLLAAGLILAFIPSRWSAPVAWAGLLLSVLSGHMMLSTGQIVFWACAAAMVTAIDFMLPPQVAGSRHGVMYIVTATLLGTLVGMIASGAAMIVGAAVGAFAGALAFSRTPRGHDLTFPSRRFVNYLAAKGMPAVVTMCIIGIAVALLISQYQLIPQ